jgi:rubrerythrin
MDNNGNNKKTVREERLNRIGLRLRLKSFLQTSYRFTIALLIIYTVLLLLCRFLTLIPDYFTYVSLIIPLCVAGILGILFHKSPRKEDCAKLADDTNGTKDLFFTASIIEKSHGEYTPLLMKNAEKEAEKIDPSKTIPFRFRKQVVNLVLALFILTLGVAFIPQFDPFGKVEARKREKENKEKLEKIDKAVKERLKTLKKHDSEKNSPEVEKIMNQIKKEFDSMKKSKPKNNREKLKQIQKTLSDVWKKKKDQKLRDQIENNLGKQGFGMLDKKQKMWKKQIEKSDFSGIKKEAEALQKMAKQISEMKDSEKKEEKQKELAKKMKDLSDFMSSQVGSKSAQGALKDAMTQMDMSKMKGLNKDALNSMQNSMELFQRELERLGQMNNDISQLEQAMEASQLAQQLNQLGEMKNAAKQGLESMQEYADYYEEMMKQARAGQGEGTCPHCGGQGISIDGEPGDGQGTCPVCGAKGNPGNPGGGGAPVDENPNAITSTKKEISKSQLQPGKILMKWNTKGMGKTGKAKEEYLESVKKVKQGVSEAILKEQIPPGYHDSIKKYFDNIEKE